MATCNIPNPVVVSHPVTHQFVTLTKGAEFDDKDPIVKEFGWAFDVPAKRGSRERAVTAPDETRGE